MKNLFLTFLLFIGISAFSNAQSVFSLQPIPASGSGDSSDVAVDAQITNLTGTTIHMKWERIVIELTSGCETAVCDPKICWARFISSRPFDMDPNEVGGMLVHFYNNGGSCEGIIHIKVTNLDNTADTTSGVFLFNQNSSVKDLPVANVKLYPNPVTSFFSLENAENVAAIRVFSLDGKEVVRFDATESNNFYSIQ